MVRRLVGLSGSLGLKSKTRGLVEHAVDATRARFAVTTAVYDLNDLQPSLGQAAHRHDLAPAATAILDDLIGADALVIGTPVYKGSYTGLFKHFFDLVEPDDLAGKPVLLLATGGGRRHALVIEHQLRPLFGFFEALTLPTGVYAEVSEFKGTEVCSLPLTARLERAVGQFAPWLETGTQTRRIAVASG
ncbi:FMN reductase [Rhodovulum strictum]|uniref:FMN reductase n=1 Tax=Rhodovulum strictum TaxID=58314 RepID=A0A844BFM7_9RHOB|nr:FMN reductase [Rhodovulum strictum]MRH21399.1 FMN reductase [Rhodovulum strictum]